ncbi:translation elongation factor Ts [Candidatus Parcubacteria bacterium]|nr:translation elongation factor Ts [Patescibacteria group bacterium]MCG2694331.1 translation elongation factor Ts [Candidatus Parcubacteria bacterium]
MDTSIITKLRQMTGCGMMDCKNVLEEVDGDLEKAVEVLRKKGIAKATKRGERETREGLVVSYIHSNNRIGVLLELLSETDFVAMNSGFRELANDIAMHIAAMNPVYLSETDVPEDVLNKEREIYAEEFEGAGKSQEVVDKIVEGKMVKFYEENCLLNQRFIKDEDVTIDELVKGKVGVIGENIQIGRFSRFEI